MDSKTKQIGRVMLQLESNYSPVLRQETFKFGPFVFTVVTAGLRNFYLR